MLPKGTRLIKADLFTLENHTRFSVINGDWVGYIEIENDTHYLVNSRGRFKITEDTNKLLDIEILGTVAEHLDKMKELTKRMDRCFSGVPF